MSLDDPVHEAAPERPSGFGGRGSANTAPQPKPTLPKPTIDDLAPSPTPTRLIEPTPSQLREMVSHLELRRIHPVLIFGTLLSGKSTMLQSMLAYLSVDAEAGVQATEGAPIVPADFPEAQQRIKDGSAFFQRSPQEFLRNRVAVKTNKPAPFFVPVDLAPHRHAAARNGRVSLAFLESMGEWYLPETYKNKGDDSARLFQPFKPEIEAILRHYGAGLSVIFVGPIATIGNRMRSADEVTADEPTISARTAGANGDDVPVIGRDPVHDLALLGSLRQYLELRPDKSRDNHLFLTSMWDLLPAQHANQPVRTDVDREEMVDLLKQHYPQSWALFSQMMGLRPGARTFMPYSASRFVGGVPVRQQDAHQAVFDRFNRILWDWIYGNARQSLDRLDGRSGRDPKRVPLFDDVTIAEPSVSGNLLDGLLRAVTLSFVFGAAPVSSP